MKKKLIAILLTALMVVPMGVLSASADMSSIPAEPTVTSTNKYYIAFDYDETKTILTEKATATNDGLTPQTARTCNSGSGNAWGEEGEGDINTSLMYTLFKEGGTVVAVGKAHSGLGGTIPATDTPIMFTAVDGTTDYTSRNDDGTPKTMDENGKNAGQFGMLLIANGKTLTFMGDVIFDNIVILDRSTTSHTVGGTLSVGSTGKMVIKDTVTVTKMTGLNTTLNVEEGGYAYLHAAGFENYTGKGTLVIDEALKAEVEPLLSSFEGKVEYVKSESDSTTTAGNTTTTAPTDNPTTGDTTVVFAALAALSVVACISVVIAKKSKSDRA